MIAGVGTDIVEIGRIERMLAKFGDSFRERICTLSELSEGDRRKHASTYYAGRWAVKEATAKALGCGIGANCNFTDVELGNDESGAPFLKLCGQAAEFAAKRGGGKFHVSLSHEATYATAVVIWEIA
ncbi:MAG: holo-ACP synthase [Victivallales bacterium]|jgi:holo-[acyl-carrier protein] synthase|nr:holo-ACP synthase [Victivallales bacterium]